VEAGGYCGAIDATGANLVRLRGLHGAEATHILQITSAARPDRAPRSLRRVTVGDFDPKRRALGVWRHKREQPRQETLAIPADLVEHLKAFIAWKDQVGQPTGKDAALFVGKRGPLTPQGLMQVWKAAVKRAGLPKELSIHSARHTLAVHLLRKTGNLRQVQKQLGHANPATTANMYADVSFEDMQAGVTGLYGEK